MITVTTYGMTIEIHEKNDQNILKVGSEKLVIIFYKISVLYMKQNTVT